MKQEHTLACFICSKLRGIKYSFSSAEVERELFF